MDVEAPIERRLLAVEGAVADLQRRLPLIAPAPDWLGQVTGSMKDEPAFEEVLALGRAFRAEDRPAVGDSW